MFSKLFEALYLKVFVNIVVKESKSIVYVELLNNKGVIRTDEESFDTTSLDDAMYHYIKSFTKESPFHYISLLDISREQGAVPTCAKNILSNFHDMSSCEYKCYNKEWTFYTSKNDLYALERRYEKIGIDFLFSPFILLHNFFQDKIDVHKAMYVLIEEQYISVSIFFGSTLLYAKHLEMQSHEEHEELMMPDVAFDEDEDEDSIDFDNLDALDNDDDMKEFGSIEDLDTLDDLDDFSDLKEMDEEFDAMQSTTVEDELSGFNQDYQRFLLIQSAVKNFYKDERYKSEFVETVYLADGVGISKDLKKYLEEEMFLSVYVRTINLTHELCKTAKLELQ